MNDKVKETSEELLIKIINFIVESEGEEVEKNDLLLELATSLVTATIDIDKDMGDIYCDIAQATNDIASMAISGIDKYKSGDESRVKKEWKSEK